MTRLAHFVTVLMASIWSLTSWRAPVSFPIWSLSIWPEIEEHGGRGGVGGADSGGGVEEAGAGHDEGDAEAAAGPGVAVGHVCGALLVAVGDEAYAGLVV